MTLTDQPKGSNKAKAVNLVTTDGDKLFNSRIQSPAVSTTTHLEDITHVINTDAAKVLGYPVFNATTGITVFASGATDGAVWHYYDSTTAHTPV